ncbi:HTH-type transcriptional activator IlvY [Desulfogranum mediterraneum]|uniref:HTH-type transcriptional activator IlvY n=1 Tax=Desulfogranum mediterraneum TaxID=160661 RepID=UPI0003FF150F|nr:HTH-type transcriptional activator IlvY [Desulfogranum mediterraneum]
MDIRMIKIFNHLAASLHFGKTSRAFNMTPSTLSRTIQRLERDVGRPLFDRDNRSVSLTRAGVIFRDYAEDAELRWHSLQQQLSVGEQLSGHLSLYCSVTAAHSILPDILSTFRGEYPGIQLHLQTGDAAMALAKLQNREADITVAALPETLPLWIESIAVTRTPLVFIAPAAHQEIMVATPEGSIDWQATPIILPEQGLSRDRLDAWFKAHHIQANVYAQVAGNEALLTMVSLGCGIGVVPQLVLEKSLIRHEVVALENVPELTPFTIGVCTAQKHLENPLIQAFWKIVRRRAPAAA